MKRTAADICDHIYASAEIARKTMSLKIFVLRRAANRLTDQASFQSVIWYSPAKPNTESFDRVMNTGAFFIPRAVLLLGLLGFCAAARGDNIVGTVTSVAGVPVPGVVVGATHIPPDLKPHSDTTDAAGAYVISVFSSGSGNYTVTPNKAGYTFTPTRRTVTLTLGGPDTNASFTTPASVPVATSQAASSVLTTSAILNGLVNPAVDATIAWFD